MELRVRQVWCVPESLVVSIMSRYHESGHSPANFNTEHSIAVTIIAHKQHQHLSLTRIMM